LQHRYEYLSIQILIIHDNSGKKKAKTEKNLCLFTCLAFRAVYLEIAYGLEFQIPCFLNALNRMINTRGVPDEMLSDNGANFVAANKELCELLCKDPRKQL